VKVKSVYKIKRDVNVKYENKGRNFDIVKDKKIDCMIEVKKMEK
jgi:hypothetical protein